MIAVVGAGGTIGRRVASFLEEWGHDVRPLDFRFERPRHVDVRDASSLARALEGATEVVNCADYRLNLEVMHGALAAGAGYVDLGGLFHMTRRQLELDDDFRAAGLTAVVGMGSAPGKTNLLARAAVERLGAEPRRLEIWAATRDPAAADHPFPAPYSVRTLLDELEMRPMVVRDGRLTDVEPLSGAAERELPDPVGRAAGIFTLHSELATLPARYPSLQEASFRLCLSPGLLEKLLALPEGAEPQPYEQSPSSVAVHLVEAADSSRAVVGMTLTRGGSARSTSEPAARAAAELAAGRLAAPGVQPPEDAVADPEGFLALLDTEVRWEESAGPGS
ncbi:MAG TPA: saccharopine dehydrogenase NADP-binding domain-containing protein [Gaiellaceae bacterium]|nr:saccharopine dehydrogenase NADP-binding domain-containing protein [Gaiellaceae bacterium]